MFSSCFFHILEFLLSFFFFLSNFVFIIKFSQKKISSLYILKILPLPDATFFSENAGDEKKSGLGKGGALGLWVTAELFLCCSHGSNRGTSLASVIDK